MPGIKKLGIVERLIRSIQEMLSLVLPDITTVMGLKKEISSTINIHNKKIHSKINMSPKKFLELRKIYKNPWEMSSKFGLKTQFDYDNNKKIIQDKLKKIKKHFPVDSSVRLFRKVSRNLKRSHNSSWSNEIFFIDGFKIPLLGHSNIGIYLRNRSGKRIKGITYSELIKHVSIPKKWEIKKINRFIKKKKSIRCSFVNHPDSFFKDIPISDINDYIINKKIKKQINDWKKKWDFA